MTYVSDTYIHTHIAPATHGYRKSNSNLQKSQQLYPAPTLLPLQTRLLRALRSQHSPRFENWRHNSNWIIRYKHAKCVHTANTHTHISTNMQEDERRMPNAEQRMPMKVWSCGTMCNHIAIAVGFCCCFYCCC